MTENQYSLVTDIAVIRSAKAVLRNLAADCGHEHVPLKEWQEVMQKLMKWEEAIRNDIEELD